MKPDNINIPDQELLQRYYNGGDNRWLGFLLQRYTLLLFGVCMKYLKDEEEAKDAVQQVFEKAILELGKYKIDFFKSWIYMVAKNHCLMKLRERGHKASAPAAQLEKAAAEETDWQLQMKKEELLELLTAALPTLASEQRECIERFYLKKESYQDIAAATGFSMMQVKSYIQNGKRNLKLFLQKRMQHE